MKTIKEQIQELVNTNDVESIEELNTGACNILYILTLDKRVEASLLDISRLSASALIQ